MPTTRRAGRTTHVSQLLGADSSAAIIVKQIECVLQLLYLLLGQVVRRFGLQAAHFC